MSASRDSTLGATARLSAILRDEGGAAALWTGFGATVVRSVPFETLRLSLYPRILAALLVGSSGGGGGVAIVDSASSGAIAGLAASITAALLTQPLDTLKTALQLEREAEGEAALASPLQRLRGAAASVVAQGGPAALYRGTAARAVSVGLAGGISFGVFEAVLPAVEALLEPELSVSM